MVEGGCRTCPQAGKQLWGTTDRAQLQLGGGIEPASKNQQPSGARRMLPQAVQSRAQLRHVRREPDTNANSCHAPALNIHREPLEEPIVIVRAANSEKAAALPYVDVGQHRHSA